MNRDEQIYRLVAAFVGREFNQVVQPHDKIMKAIKDELTALRRDVERAKSYNPEPLTITTWLKDIFSKTRVRQILVISVGSTLVPAIGFITTLAPSWPPMIGLISTIINLTFALSVMHRPRKTDDGVAKQLRFVPIMLGLAVSTYIFLIAFFTFEIPGSRERWAKGYACTSEAVLVYQNKCPSLDIDELRAADNEATRLWTVGSVSIVRVAMGVLWIFIGFAVCQLFCIFSSRREHRDLRRTPRIDLEYFQLQPSPTKSDYAARHGQRDLT